MVVGTGKDGRDERLEERHEGWKVIIFIIHEYVHVPVYVCKHCPGSGMFIPDPEFHPSRISDPRVRIQQQQKREGGNLLSYLFVVTNISKLKLFYF